MLVDAHLHVWDPDRLHYDWLSYVPEINRRFTLAELAEEEPRVAAGEVRFVFVQADCLPTEAVDEVDWVTSMASDGVGAIVAFAPVEDAAALDTALAAYAERPLVTGIRRLLQSEESGFAQRPEFVAGARRLAEAGLVFDVCVVAAQLPDVIALADAIPELTIVLDHLGKPAVGGGSDADAAWRADLAALAARPNTVAKVSGLPSLTDASWTDELVRPYLDAALETFGAERLLFGGDWPASRPQARYPRWLDAVERWAGPLTPTERAELFTETATRVYRLA